MKKLLFAILLFAPILNYASDIKHNKSYVQKGTNFDSYLIKGNGEECEVVVGNKEWINSTSCLSITNSKGIKILCTKKKKMCKTETEFVNFVKSSEIQTESSNNDQIPTQQIDTALEQDKEVVNKNKKVQIKESPDNSSIITGIFKGTLNKNGMCLMEFVRGTYSPDISMEPYQLFGCPENDIAMFNNNKEKLFIISYAPKQIRLKSNKIVTLPIYLSASMVNTDLDKYVSYKINKDSVNIYLLPDSNSEVIGKYLKNDSPIRVGAYVKNNSSKNIDQNEEWIKVNQGLHQGWILKNHLTQVTSIWQTYYLGVVCIIIMVFLGIAYFNALVPDGRYSSGYKPVDLTLPIMGAFVFYMIMYSLLWAVSYIFSIDWIGTNGESFFEDAYRSFSLGLEQVIDWIFMVFSEK